MTRHGRPALFGALICFVIYFSNVAFGAAGRGVFLGDLGEMLLLFAAAVLFVAGTLTREAEAKSRPEKTR